MGLLLVDERATSVSAVVGDGSLIPLELVPVLNTLDEGMEEGYCLVGTDIEPGTYWLEDLPMAKGGTFHYWGRHDDQMVIIENEYLENSGGVQVTVEQDDFAFVYTGLLRPTAAITDRSQSTGDSTTEFPYAEASEMASLTGVLFAGAQGAGLGEGLSTTWLPQLDEGVVGPASAASAVVKLLGSFVTSKTTLAKTWTVISVRTSLGNQGLVVLSQGRGEMTKGVAFGTRILVPIVVDADVEAHDLDQVRATVDWMLAKVSSAYMAYVPLAESESDRSAVVQATIAQAGTPVAGPLSDPQWLADPMILATLSNPSGFPGPGSQRLGVLQPRESGCVDIYAGWQLDLSVGSDGMLGFAMFGHRSILGLIDAVCAVPGLRRELGSGRSPISPKDLSGLKAKASRANPRQASTPPSSPQTPTPPAPPPTPTPAVTPPVVPANDAATPKKRWWKRS